MFFLIIVNYIEAYYMHKNTEVRDKANQRKTVIEHKHEVVLI